MKTTILASIFTLMLGGGFSQTGSLSQNSKTEFKVLGECSMCKSRIEKAAKTDGVTSAVWDKETKILKVEYHPSKIKVETIHNNIAKVGHDTDKKKAEDAVYNKLPACCKYERNIERKEHKQRSNSTCNCCP